MPALGSRLVAYLSLTKPRLVLMVLVTVAVGYLLGARGRAQPATLALTLLGTALVAGGAGALNQWLERSRDALMRRTAGRALPSGRLSVGEAVSFGVFLAVAGTPAVAPGRQPPRGLGRPGDVLALCLRLHAAQAADVAEHGDRSDPRRPAAHDRLGGRDRPAWDRGLGPVPDRVPLAVPALPGHRLDLPGRLPPRRLPDAHGAGRPGPDDRAARPCRMPWP